MRNTPSWKIRSLLIVGATLPLAHLFASSALAANLLHQYTFNDGTINDSVGTADGTLIDPNLIAGFNAGRVDLTANNGVAAAEPFTEGAYVDLPDGLFTSSVSAGVFGAISIEAWVNVQEHRQNARIWSFGDADEGTTWGEQTDWLDLNGQNFGGNLALTTHELNQGFNVNELEDAGTLPTGALHHLVATFDANDSMGGTNLFGTMRLYVNNSPVGTAAISDFLPLDMMNDVNNWLGRSQWADPLFDGQIDEFSLYDDVLSPAEVAANFSTGPVPTPIPTFVIDRDTGEVRIENQTPINFNLVDYAMTSAAGGLDAEGWQSIAENGDADSGAGFDPVGIWTESAATASELAEGTAGSGGQVAATTGSWSLGPAWLQSPTEDLQVMFELSDGSSGLADVSFVGNGGNPLGRSDLNADGMVDVDDWVIFLANSDTVFTDVTSVQAYLGGDLDGDFDNDFRDFRLFQSDFIAENGAAAFAALTGVPEPATAILLVAGLAGLALRRRKRVLTSVAAALSLLIVCAMTSGVAMAADPALYVASDDPSFDPDANDGTADAWTVTLSDEGGRGTFLGFGELGIGDAWVLFSFPSGEMNGSVDADHSLVGGPLSVGQSIRLDFANSWVAEGGSVGVSLFSGGNPITTFKYVGEDPDGVYRYDDAGGTDQSTGVPYVDRTPGKLEISLDSATMYTAAYGFDSWTGTYSGSIDGIRVFNDMGGDRSDVIFNNLEIGQTSLVPLSLEVNKATGDVAIQGNATLAANIDYYQISSPENALDPVLWNSLDEQEGDAPGEGWDASPNVGTSRLTEYFLREGGATLTAGSELSLGQAYDNSVFGAADGDLEFVYAIAGGARLTGTVSYTTSLEADFDGDGDVDGNDFLLWQSGFPTPSGAVKMDGDYDNDGDVDGNDFLGWQTEFPSPGSGAGSVAVPEPASVVLVMLALVGVVVRGRWC